MKSMLIDQSSRPSLFNRFQPILINELNINLLKNKKKCVKFIFEPMQVNITIR